MEEFEKLKSKVLKYILYKKRTEAEIKQKFSKENQELLEKIVDHFKELEYINDLEYIKRSIEEFIRVKNLSIKELKYKLIAKGLNKNSVEEYIEKNWNKLYEYEENSAQKILLKKQNTMEQEKIKEFLMTKGYRTDIIEILLNNNFEK